MKYSLIELANIRQVVDSVNKIIHQYQQALLVKQHRGVVLLIGDECWYAEVIKQWFIAQHTELVNSKKQFTVMASQQLTFLNNY